MCSEMVLYIKKLLKLIFLQRKDNNVAVNFNNLKICFKTYFPHKALLGITPKTLIGVSDVVDVTSQNKEIVG